MQTFFLLHIFPNFYLKLTNIYFIFYLYTFYYKVYKRILKVYIYIYLYSLELPSKGSCCLEGMLSFLLSEFIFSIN